MALPHSEWARTLKPSPTLEIKAVADALVAEGKDVVNFGIGEMNPEIALPEAVKDGIKAALDADATHYSPAAGDPELIEAIREDLGRFGLSYDTEQIVVCPGPKDAIFKIALTVLNRTAERHRLVMLTPGYESFENIPLLVTGRGPILFDTDDNFLPEPDKLDALLTQDKSIGAIVLNSPNNPTGAIYDQALLSQLAEVLARHPEVAIISDEVYRTIYYDGRKYASIASLLPEQTFIVGGMSKEVSGTGLRLGFVAGPKSRMGTLAVVEGNASSCVNLPTQKGYARFLREDADFRVRHSIRDALQERRDLLLEGFRTAAPDAIWKKPGGAFYFFPEVTPYIGRRTPGGQRLESDGDISRYIIEEGCVVCLPGSLFQRPGHLRFAFAVPHARIADGMKRIGTVLATLR